EMVVEGPAVIPQGNGVTETHTQGTDQEGPTLLVAGGKIKMLTLTEGTATAPDPDPNPLEATQDGDNEELFL
ncbi:hypothetical protein CRG98_028672, partial [Punica granatum]